MFWDKAAGFYDIFETWYNGEVNRKLVAEVAELIEADDKVLECACGTGMISKGIAPRCRKLVASDFSEGMLRQAQKNCACFDNVKIKKSDITHLKCRDEYFDKVVAGNVIHLLDEPYKALNELLRVCKRGGMVIIPTYVNNENAGEPGLFIKCLERFGADFKKQFDYESYKQFFAESGIENIEFKLVSGKMPCGIAIIRK